MPLEAPQHHGPARWIGVEHPVLTLAVEVENLAAEELQRDGVAICMRLTWASRAACSSARIRGMRSSVIAAPPRWAICSTGDCG